MGSPEASSSCPSSGKDQGEALSESKVEAREPNEDSHLRLGRAFLAPSEVLEGLGANPLVFVGLSAILPLLHTSCFSFKVSKSIRRSLRLF